MIDAGELDHVDRSTWHRGLELRAANIRKADEEQAYTRALTDDVLGQLLFKAHQAAPLLKIGLTDNRQSLAYFSAYATLSG